MDLTSVNILAVLTGAIALMVMGAVWYGPLFGARWMASVGITDEMKRQTKKDAMRKTWAMGFCNSLVLSYTLNLFINTLGAFSWTQGAIVGAVIGVGFITTTLFSAVIWEGKKLETFYINAGYYILAPAIVSAIFAVWP